MTIDHAPLQTPVPDSLAPSTVVLQDHIDRIWFRLAGSVHPLAQPLALYLMEMLPEVTAGFAKSGKGRVTPAEWDYALLASVEPSQVWNELLAVGARHLDLDFRMLDLLIRFQYVEGIAELIDTDANPSLAESRAEYLYRRHADLFSSLPG